jgi:NhaP-type Na+/H+ or K+/H+ antiporter
VDVILAGMKSLLAGKTAAAVVVMLLLGVAVSYALLWMLRWFFDRQWMKNIIRKCLKLDL